ncbi:Kae1-associated serine/threonine protein kinase [Candidatus Micrarchaeota archaeon]|nr:Kae1-associated serine/threonine protein kinase [Candidatus Micrarchaeota archaeon]
MKGAEAVVLETEFLGRKMLKKERRKKGYRIKELDKRIREGRTRREARLLHKAKKGGVSCPVVYEVGKDYIVMSRMGGKKPEENGEEMEKAGKLLAKLHSAGILHGDFTPYNLLVEKGELHAIDFGLGSFSRKTEGRADDMLTMLRAIKSGEAFIAGYREFPEAEQVIKKVGEIENRARYR